MPGMRTRQLINCPACKLLDAGKKRAKVIINEGCENLMNFLAYFRDIIEYILKRFPVTLKVAGFHLSRDCSAPTAHTFVRVVDEKR